MSILQYGNLKFGPQGWLTLHFNQEAWMDPTRTDMMGIHLGIDGHYILSAPIEPMSGSLSTTDGKQFTSPAAAMPTLRNLGNFMQPRQKLSFTVNGVQLVPTSTKFDSNNGPIPLRCNIVQTGEASFLCDLAIESWWTENEPLSQGGIVLSHRWKEECAIDRHFLSSKTRTGKIIVASSEFRTGGNILDGLRETLVTTSIDPGFAREGGSSYTISENGLEMAYRCGPDVEQFRMMPLGTTEADGECNITSQRMSSPGRYQTCWVMLRGPKTTESEPAKLIRTATAIAYSKLRLNGGFFPTKADFKERLWKNEVMVSLTGYVRTANELALKKSLTLQESMRGFGQVVPVQVGTHSPDPGSRGTADLLLHAAAFHDPRLAQTLQRLTNTVRDGGKQQFGTAFDTSIPGG